MRGRTSEGVAKSRVVPSVPQVALWSSRNSAKMEKLEEAEKVFREVKEGEWLQGLKSEKRAELHCSFLSLFEGSEEDTRLLHEGEPLSERGAAVVKKLDAALGVALGSGREGSGLSGEAAGLQAPLVDWRLLQDVHRAVVPPGEEKEGDEEKVRELLESHRQRCERARGEAPSLRWLVEEASEFLVRLTRPEEAPFADGEANLSVAVAVVQRFLGLFCLLLVVGICMSSCLRISQPSACLSVCPCGR